MDQTLSSQEDASFEDIYDIKIVPNPSHGEFVLEGINEISEDVITTIYNQQGQLIRRFMEKPSLIELTYPGFYYIRIDAMGSTSTKRIIVVE